MRGPALALMGIGGPLLVMMLLWQWWTAPVPMADTAAPSPLTAQTRPAAPEPSRAPPPPPYVEPAALMPNHLGKTIDDWVERFKLPALESLSEPADAQAARLLVERDYERAVRAYDRLMLKRPSDPEVLLGKAVALSGAGRYEDAVPLFERLLEMEPDNIGARFDFAVAQMRAGRLDAAEKSLREIIAIQPDDERSLFNLAVLLQSQGKYQDAMTLWRELTDRRVDIAKVTRALFHRGECAMALKDPGEAETCFLNVLQYDNTDLQAWANLGIARAAGGRLRPAIAALRQALLLNQNYVPALNQMAYVYAELYRENESVDGAKAAIEYCEKSLTIDPAQPNIQELRIALSDFADPVPSFLR